MFAVKECPSAVGQCHALTVDSCLREFLRMKALSRKTGHMFLMKPGKFSGTRITCGMDSTWLNVHHSRVEAWMDRYGT